jgi:hypothetical protein
MGLYDENTDWRAFLRDALHGSLYQGLQIDRHVGLSMPDALGALSEALQGTPMEIRLADAAMEIIERGNNEEMDTVSSTGWANAPDAFERLLALIERTPTTFSRRWMLMFYSALFRLKPTEPRLLAALARDAGGRGGAELLVFPARYNPQWLATHLSELCASHCVADLKMDRWIWITGVPEAADPRPALGFSPEEGRSLLLTAIAQLGEPYASSLVEQVSVLPHSSKAHTELTNALEPTQTSRAGLNKQRRRQAGESLWLVERDTHFSSKELEWESFESRLGELLDFQPAMQKPDAGTDASIDTTHEFFVRYKLQDDRGSRPHHRPDRSGPSERGAFGYAGAALRLGT